MLVFMLWKGEQPKVFPITNEMVRTVRHKQQTAEEETGVKESSQALANEAWQQWPWRWMAPPKGSWRRRHSRGRISRWETKGSSKGKAESKNGPWFQRELPFAATTVKPFAATGNQRKKAAREWSPGRPLCSLLSAAMAVPTERLRGGVLRQPEGQSQQTEARMYESTAWTRQPLYKRSYCTVITSSLSPGLFRN